MLSSSLLCRKAHAVRRVRQMSSTTEKFWAWTSQQRPSWKQDYKEAAIIFCVFGITGSSSVYFVRPLLKKVGIVGTMQDGPWSYRILSVLLVSPVYATILLTLGTISGRHCFFANMVIKMFGRVMPKSLLNKLKCPPAREK
jgi:hypothetical protein